MLDIFKSQLCGFSAQKYSIKQKTYKHLMSSALCPIKTMRSIIEELQAIDSLALQGAVSSHYIEITSVKGETVISANREGLIHLALQLLSIAECDSPGAHYHLDEASMADSAEVSVVFSLIKSTARA